jgi:hypothetical protein
VNPVRRSLEDFFLANLEPSAEPRKAEAVRP